MKETKKFFDANGLNKGYSKALFSKPSNLAVSSSSQYKHIMPPLDVMAAYEEISPGTIKKIIEMAQKEQNYRHSIELLNVEKYDRAVKFGKICGVACNRDYCHDSSHFSIRWALYDRFCLFLVCFRYDWWYIFFSV
jgi:uncharacterized membrane protein